MLTSRWAALSLASLVYWTGTQALKPMLALELQALGSSDALIGLVLGASSMVTFLASVPGGRAIDRIGLRRSLMAGEIGIALAGVAFLGAEGVGPLTAVLVAAGIAELAAWLALQALVSHAGTGDALRRQLALFSFAWGAGLAIGPAIGSFLYVRFGFGALGLCYVVGGGVGLLASALVPVGRGVPEPHGVAPLGTAIRTMWSSQAVRAVLLSSFVCLFVYGIRNSFYPLLLERQGIPVDQIGLLLSVFGVASLLVRLPLPALARRVGPERLLLVSMWLALVVITVTPWLGSLWLHLPAAVLVGVGVGVNPPMTVELMAAHTGAHERGLAMGLRVGFNRLSQLVQPVLFGAVAAVAGLPLAFAAGGLLMGAVAAAARPRAST